jgi:indolepyruvate ferredoxin oxidoreductase beta subunit
MTTVNVFFAGVGGQGIITGASIIARAAVDDGINAVMSEVHGMAQRGGSVVCELRLGNVRSPLIPQGEADLLIAFEPVEAVRNLPRVNRKSVVVTEVRPIVPVSVSLGGLVYPAVDDLVAFMREQVAAVHAVGASAAAEEIGLPQAANMVLLGAAMGTGLIPVRREALIATIRRTVPEKTLERNLQAFETGLQMTGGSEAIGSISV